MEKVRGKFRVDNVILYGNDYDGTPLAQINLSAVTSGNEEDSVFGKYTPSGTISFNCRNQKVIEAMKPEKKFYVDFTPVE